MSKKETFAAKVSAAAGSLAALTPMAADAAVVHQDEVVSLSLDAGNGAQVEWDVNGDDAYDFYLRVQSTNYLEFNSNGRNGRGFVHKVGSANKAVQNLSPDFVVGPILAGGYTFPPHGVGGRAAISAVNANTPRGSAFEGFTNNAPGSSLDTSGFVGFRFVDDGGGLFYGWAHITIDWFNSIGNGTFTIHEWAYEDTGAEIHVGAVPEPNSLALLALGAAGLTAWRTRRKQAG